ncbi:MAG: hypothetical protein QXQ53_04480 [Candidatus Methanosuratincola sp.]
MADKENQVVVEKEKTDLLTQIVGTPIELEAIDAAHKLKLSTAMGAVSLVEFEQLVKAKLAEYIRFGVARRTWQIMTDQAARSSHKTPSMDDLKLILLEMARQEVKYGLLPLYHTIPIDGKLYVTADGYRYYAEHSGKLKSISWERVKEGDVDVVRCRVTRTDGAEFLGEAFVDNKRSPNDDPVERARTKSMRRALRRAFPVGMDAEPLEYGALETEVFEDIPFAQLPKQEQLKWLARTDELIKQIAKFTGEPVEEIKKRTLAEFGVTSRKELTTSQLNAYMEKLSEMLQTLEKGGKSNA